ncbi:hypothetical protein [Bacillus sp. P14.5]|uniref:hypothetical protein n=1 Tax=Bacillus sp. P14.5 TaxID=1983400 RepID=UPI001964FA9F|nr:hypothetical protein [Bacillus sp. P14.5]
MTKPAAWKRKVLLSLSKPHPYARRPNEPGRSAQQSYQPSHLQTAILFNSGKFKSPMNHYKSSILIRARFIQLGATLK